MLKAVSIGETCFVTDYVANGSFQSLRENVQYLDDDGYAILVRLTDFTKNWNGNYKFVSKDAYNFLSKSSLQAGDLIISNVGEPGKTFLVPDLGRPMTLAPNSILVRPNSSEISTQFLKYYIDSPNGQRLIKSIESGTTQRKFNKTSFRALQIFAPPLAEQQRIVAKLDAAFAEIDEAVSYSQQNVTNAERLYSYGIDEVFAPMYHLVQPLGNNSKINYGYTAKASFSEGTHKFLRITDIQDNSVDWNGVPFCNIEDTKLPKMLLHDGDIVFARTGATTGKSFLVQNPKDAVFASYLIRVSVDRDILLPRYVMHFFQSETYWLQVNEGISGTAQGGFNASKLAELKVPVISIEEQQNVIDRLDVLCEQTTQLTSIYGKKLEHQIALKSAILANELQSEAA